MALRRKNGGSGSKGKGEETGKGRTGTTTRPAAGPERRQATRKTPSQITDELSRSAEERPTMPIEPIAGTDSASPAADLIDPRAVRNGVRKRSTPARTKSGAPRSRTPKEKQSSAAREVEDELQTVGADVVPRDTVEVVSAPSAGDTVDPRAIREHTIDQISPVENEAHAILTDWDFHLFNEGTHHKLWTRLGSHIVPGGVVFGVWAPNAERVSVVGDFNGWNRQSAPLAARGASGLWEGFVPGIGKGNVYKYHIVSKWNGYSVDKADPMAVHHETPPRTASIVWDLDYEWSDREWMASRGPRNGQDAPMSIYEVHLGSWRRTSGCRCNMPGCRTGAASCARRWGPACAT